MGLRLVPAALDLAQCDDLDLRPARRADCCADLAVSDGVGGFDRRRLERVARPDLAAGRDRRGPTRAEATLPALEQEPVACRPGSRRQRHGSGPIRRNIACIGSLAPPTLVT